MWVLIFILCVVLLCLFGCGLASKPAPSWTASQVLADQQDHPSKIITDGANVYFLTGGTVAFCGEPSRYGDFLAAIPKRTALLTAPLWRRLMGASARDYEAEGAHENGHDLEPEVDVHAFSPGDLRRFCDGAGLSEVRVKGEELLASIHGWTVRTLEASAEPDEVPWGWRRFAFRSYLALQRVDNQVLEPRLPPQLFYNLLVSARRP